MIAILAMLATMTESKFSNSVEINGSFLPTDPMVIHMGTIDSSTESVEYKGCHKFCVGKIEGMPRSDRVWNPYNQSTEELYLFRYVRVNMSKCFFSEAPQILELFLDFDENNGDYLLSRPSKEVTTDTFHFLVYNPETDARYSFHVRWTAYLNACNTSDKTAPIRKHFEKDTFPVEQFVPVFQDD